MIYFAVCFIFALGNALVGPCSEEQTFFAKFLHAFVSLCAIIQNKWHNLRSTVCRYLETVIISWKRVKEDCMVCNVGKDW